MSSAKGKKSKGRIEKFNRKAQVVDFKKAQKKKAKEEAEARKVRKRVAAEAQAQGEKKAAGTKSRKRFDRQKRRRYLFVASIVILALVITAASTMGIVRMKVEQDRLEARQQELQAEKDKLKQELETINDPEYIEQQARKQLNLIMPGETLYLLPNEDSKQKQAGDGE